MKNSWYKQYEQLSLQGGKFTPIVEDDEDMFTITYNNGLTIDVGYIKEENSYYITVVYHDNWQNIIEEIPVINKENLLLAVQSTINKYRK